MSEPQRFHGPNEGYLLDLYERYCEDPSAVDEVTRQFFATWSLAPNGAQIQVVSEPAGPRLIGKGNGNGTNGAASPALPAASVTNGTASKPATALSNGNGNATVPVSRIPALTAEQRTHPASIVEARPSGRMPSKEHHSLGSDSGETPPVLPSDIPDDFSQLYPIPYIVGTARLVRLIREYGHLSAQLDPLGSPPPDDPGLQLATHKLTEDILRALPPTAVRSLQDPTATNALEAIHSLRRIYCGPIGYDYHHVKVYEERVWLRETAESGRFLNGFDNGYMREVLERLTAVETFERFLHQKFIGQKRFSLEGNDVLIPMLDALIHDAAGAITHEVVIGMAHRGRLNVLAHILGKPYSAILSEFQGAAADYNQATYLGYTGDVKYHLGARRAYQEGGVYEMPVTLVPNPSHLEFVNAVVEGRARAAQEIRGTRGLPIKDWRASLPVLIHGDASFPGQGVVAETLNLSQLHGYATGGTIHIIINNQIGFTTDWRDSRSTLYAGDLAKGFEIPVIHVNADDAVACITAIRIAWAYRERFAKDFMIDLIGYRRWGHNEGDEPNYTQPDMYRIIEAHPTVREQWEQTLLLRGVISENEAEEIRKAAWNRMERALREVERRGRTEAMVAVPASALVRHPDAEPQQVTIEQLTGLNDTLLKLPEGFQPHSKLERSVLERRRKALTVEGGIDWGHAELLAFATILAEGTPIRITGQDTERGTFSQRHLVLHDPHTGERYNPLHAMPQSKASFAIYNSPLSENAVLGFEYGYSVHAPDTLVLWEAQFGDFANGAQVIIDQFIVSGWAKWGQQPSLVLLLPHGYEGQGPEHSSARLERFLQLCADGNIRVANCTTAGQYFHLLRRQAATLRSEPRPLIVMTPKKLLRHPRAASSAHDLTNGHFRPVLPAEPGISDTPPEEVKRLIFGSGKVYVDLTSDGRTNKPKALPHGIVAARIEELYPFPADAVEAVLQSYPNLQEVIWLQEEPINMGGWTFVQPRLQAAIDRLKVQQSISLRYVGRPESASPAEGVHHLHDVEQNRLLTEAVELDG
ncbi:MAG: 2-oxoglutarate dehydrogenase E1 component [Chloroflexaceae bacterium]|nr:2-oxoglutarate dehydrogenase E1 component [Chloroflexaceae bacterium]